MDNNKSYQTQVRQELIEGYGCCPKWAVNIVATLSSWIQSNKENHKSDPACTSWEIMNMTKAEILRITVQDRIEMIDTWDPTYGNSELNASSIMDALTALLEYCKHLEQLIENNNE